MARMRWGILFLVAVALLGAACGGDDDASGDESSGGHPIARPEGGGGNREGIAADQQSQAVEEGGEAPDAAPAPAGRPAMRVPSVGPDLIKTADLVVEVEADGFQEALQSVIDIAAKRGGFVLSSSVAGDDSRRGAVTIRVPSRTFEAALGEIDELGEIKSKQVATEDVSEEFIDLEARIRNFSAQEAVLLRLMDSAQTIPETIRVQNELTGVQLEIERLRGRLRFLEDQTSLSTVSVELREVGAVAPQEEDTGTLERAWQVARDTTGAIVAGFLIGGAALAPVALILLFGLLVFRWVRPRVGRVTGSAGS